MYCIRQVSRRFSEVLCDLRSDPSGLRVIALQHGSRKNALSSSLISQLQGHLLSIQSDVSARTLIIKSEVEKIFCAGADLKERVSMSQAEVEAFVNTLRYTFNLLEDLSIPTIACVDGYALGGGLEMALACDLRIAGPLAKVGLVETGIAVIPGAGGTYRLPKLVGLQRAKEMVFTAAIYSAEQAKELGVFSQVSENPFDKCKEIAASIAKNGPVAIKMAKKAMDLGWGKDRSTGMSIEALCYAGVVGTEDRVEALNAFREKRKPVFKGR